MANSTDNIQKAEKMIRTIFSGKDREKSFQISRWLLGMNDRLTSHTIKCYLTEVPDVSFCIDRGGDCNGQRIRTWFFRRRLRYDCKAKGIHFKRFIEIFGD